MKYSTFYKCTAGRVLHINTYAADIESVNVISNSPTSVYTDLFYFYSGTSLSNVYIADNKHTGIGSTIASGAAFCQNSFATTADCKDVPVIRHLSSFKCAADDILLLQSLVLSGDHSRLKQRSKRGRFGEQ
jgi:hypothetical protein